MDLVESCTTTEGAAQAVHWCVGQGLGKLHVLKALLRTHFRFASKLSDSPDLCSDILLKVMQSGSADLLEVLLPYIKLDFLCENLGGKTRVSRLLCLAVENGNSKIVRMLSKYGTSTAANCFRGRPLLHLAVLAGHLEVAKELLRAGADVMTTDIKGDPLLTSVIKHSTGDGKEDKVVWLLQNGADHKRIASSGKEPIHVAAAHSGPIIVQLVNAGCDVNTQDPINGDTPLHIACARCCEDAILTLIQQGAVFNLPNNQGETPLEKMLKFAQNYSNFHSQTRIYLAKSLVKIGFRIQLTKRHVSNSRKTSRVGRDKVADLYRTIMATVKNTGSLQHLCRLKVREELRGQTFEKSVASLDVTRVVKGYLMFQDKTPQPFSLQYFEED